MKKIYIYFFILCVGCCPGSKTEYLSKYKKFIAEVKNEWKLYNEQDWNEKTEEFEKYSTKYYKKFKGELTASEIVKVYRFDFAFHFYKGDISITQIISGKYNKVLKEYLWFFLEEIKKIGHETIMLLKDFRSESFLDIVDRLTQ